ncbi:MAG: response regulator [Hormoscilla sp.]
MMSGKILVIEDNEVMRSNLLELLEAEDFEAIGAENGQKGVELALKDPPDVILCDVMMPELDGYDVLQSLRSHPETATIPFIFMTAKADRVDLRQGMELGADDYLTKPYTPDEVLKAIGTQMKKQEAIDRSAQSKLEELRNNIVHSLPHELRTPLNGILGFSELIIYKCDQLNLPEIRDMAEGIRRSGERLHELIQNFLFYAELELLASNPEEVKLLRSNQVESTKTLIADRILIKAQAANRSDDLRLDLQDSPAQISDIMLNKIIEELIENALKFSEEDTAVSISTRCKNNQFILEMINQGRGLTPEQLAKLGAYMQFERRLYEQQGIGLGLSIVKRITELHAGQLIIESIPDQQTTVRVVLPASA